MKQDPRLERVQQRMQPGVLTLHGFLGTDTRNLAEILAADQESVRRLGLEHAEIADGLARIMERGRDIAEREIEVQGRFRVRVRDSRGRIPSPWGDGLFRKNEAMIHDSRTGHTFRVNDLTLHLIRAHGFYSGRGSPFRVEPVAAAAILAD